MLIWSQDGSVLVNGDAIISIRATPHRGGPLDPADRGHYYVRINDGLTMGEYSTKDQAMCVLSEISDTYMRYYTSFERKFASYRLPPDEGRKRDAND